MPFSLPGGSTLQWGTGRGFLAWYYLSISCDDLLLQVFSLEAVYAKCTYVIGCSPVYNQDRQSVNRASDVVCSGELVIIQKRLVLFCRREHISEYAVYCWSEKVIDWTDCCDWLDWCVVIDWTDVSIWLMDVTCTGDRSASSSTTVSSTRRHRPGTSRPCVQRRLWRTIHLHDRQQSQERALLR